MDEREKARRSWLFGVTLSATLILLALVWVLRT